MPSRADFLIVHGTYGHPEENWFPWLKQELQKFGNVRVPQFPTPEGQNLEAWLAIADQALAKCEPQNTILIGHSSGAALVLRMAERAVQPFKAVFAVCPFARELGNPFDQLNATFLHPTFNWEAIQRGAQHIACFAGDDDPYVSLAYSEEITKALAIELITIKKGGHLNADSGYREIPVLLNTIHQLFEYGAVMTKATIAITIMPHAETLGLPAYATEHAAGMDLCAAIGNDIVVEPGKRILVPTGLMIALPEGFEAQVRPRSGLALKHGVTVLNSPGTIDADYRGEVQVILANLGTEPFTITRGMRIAQMVVASYAHVSWQEVSELPSSERGAGGFGSTGTDHKKQ